MFSTTGSRHWLPALLLTGACATARPAAAPASGPPNGAEVTDANPPAAAASTLGPAEAPGAPPQAEPGAVECTLRCELPRLVSRGSPEPDYTQQETDNAMAVVSSMKNDLLACYKKRLRLNPRAYGAITVEIVVGEDGHVRKVDATGATILGRQTMACISHRIEQGVFEPPHGGGNIFIEIPFSLEVAAPDET